MPELPEVETIRRQLDPLVQDAVIVEAWGHSSAKFTEATHCAGMAIERARRRGKYLLFDLDDDAELIIHLGMTGQLSVAAGDDPSALDDYTRAWWRFDDGRILVFRDVRRFGRIRVVPAGDWSSIATLSQLGPEPFDDEFTPLSLWTAIKASNRRLKTQLLSQRPVAGLGNIYADEALWIAQIHPGRRTMSKAAAERLHPAIVEVLRSAIENRGTTLRDYRTAEGGEGANQFHLRCYGRAGEPCLRCGEPLRAKVYDARTTTWCPTCTPR